MKIIRNTYAKTRKLYYKNIAYLLNKDNKTFPKDYYGKPILSENEGSNLVENCLESSSPLMICKFGSVELNCVTNYLQIKKFRESTGIQRFYNSLKLDQDIWNEQMKYNMLNIAGFFPNTPEMLEKFSTTFLGHIHNIDILGVWFKHNEDFVSHYYCPNATLTSTKILRPFLLSKPWTRALEKKKILVIHPFEESIKSQFRKRKLLFKEETILPDFKLKTL